MRNNIILLYLCLYLVMIGYGISLPILPFYLQKLALKGGLSPQNISVHVGALTAAFAFMQMIFAPLWGKWSDNLRRRKPLLILSLSGYAFSLALTGLSENIGMLYGTRMLTGIFASAIFPLTTAYIVKLSSEKQLVKRLAWQGTTVGLGVVSGPALGSLLTKIEGRNLFNISIIEFNNFSTPFYVTAFLVIMAIIGIGIWLREPTGKRMSSSSAEPGLISVSITKALSRGPIATCLILSIVGQFALSLFEGTFVLHAQAIMNFNSTQLGVVFIVCGLVMAVAQGTIIAWFIEKYGPEKIIPAGFFLMGAGLTLLMLTESMEMILVFVGILALGMAIITPGITVIIAKHTKSNLARTLGLLAGSNSFGQTIGPLTGSILFVINIHLPYLLAATVLFLTTMYLLRTDMLKE
jgi:DHA1 family multidrug resistance protein-like MFS transporter